MQTFLVIFHIPLEMISNRKVLEKKSECNTFIHFDSFTSRDRSFKNVEHFIFRFLCEFHPFYTWIHFVPFYSLIFWNFVKFFIRFRTLNIFQPKSNKELQHFPSLYSSIRTRLVGRILGNLFYFSIPQLNESTRLECKKDLE